MRFPWAIQNSRDIRPEKASLLHSFFNVSGQAIAIGFDTLLNNTNSPTSVGIHDLLSIRAGRRGGKLISVQPRPDELRAVLGCNEFRSVPWSETARGPAAA